MDRGNKSILIIELEVFLLLGPTKSKGKLEQETHISKFLENENGGEFIRNTKKQKVHLKISNQRVNVAIEVLPYPRAQNSLFLLLKNINLE